MTPEEGEGGSFGRMERPQRWEKLSMCVQRQKEAQVRDEAMEEGGGAGLEEAGLLGKGRISILSPGQRPLEALINILTILVYI